MTQTNVQKHHAAAKNRNLSPKSNKFKFIPKSRHVGIHKVHSFSAPRELQSISSITPSLIYFVQRCIAMDCSPLSFSVHGILQARILEQVAILYCRGSSRPKAQTCISCISFTGRWIFLSLCHLGSY